MVVHVGGKRTHRRFLLLRQRIEVWLLKMQGSWSILDLWYWLFFTMLCSCSFQAISLIMLTNWDYGVKRLPLVVVKNQMGMVIMIIIWSILTPILKEYTSLDHITKYVYLI
jgi:hypothetical protein